MGLGRIVTRSRLGHGMAMISCPHQVFGRSIPTNVLSRSHFNAQPLIQDSSLNDSTNKKLKWSSILLFLPGLATFGLGTWQLMRRQWKIELLEYRQKRLNEDVMPLAKAVPGNGDYMSLEYRKVLCEGLYAEEKSLFVGPRVRTEKGNTKKGYFLITPLLPQQNDNESGQVPVLVNRGWVPSSWREDHSENKIETRKLDAPITENKTSSSFWSLFWSKKEDATKEVKPEVITTKVVGVIRESENPNMFVPSNEAEVGQWFFVDVPAMLLSLGLPKETVYIEAVRDGSPLDEFEEGYPIPKDPGALVHTSVTPQDHINYALTWYTLSFATTFMAWKRLNPKMLPRRSTQKP